jgi:DNA-binding NarL/FixJ family response regulator
MKNTTIYIADDHKIFAEGLEFILNEEPTLSVAGIARNGKQLLGMLKNKTVDLVLLDITMPELNGEETAAEILNQYPNTKILMLTMHNTIDHIAPLIKLGVHGYILKNAGKAELLLAIETLMEGNTYYSSEIANTLATELRQFDDSKVSLTQREIEVLQLVFEGLNTTEIGERIYLSPRTVETHRSNLLAKTGAKNTAQLINYGLKNGLLKLSQ